MNNKESAKMFIDAIVELANKPDNLYNFESYLSRHFDKWIENFANTPEGLAIEMKSFANMDI